MESCILNTNATTHNRLKSNHRAFAFKNQAEYICGNINLIDKLINQYQSVYVINSQIIFLGYKSLSDFNDLNFSMSMGLQNNIFEDNITQDILLDNSLLIINNTDWSKKFISCFKHSFVDSRKLQQVFDIAIDFRKYYQKLKSVKIIERFFILNHIEKHRNNSNKIKNYLAINTESLDSFVMESLAKEINKNIGVV